jgi:hypothetical protein
MATEPKILIAGGYGVFGRLLAKELLQTTTARIVIAGRDARRAVETCLWLGAPDRVEAMRLDLGRPGALESAARGCFAVACTAGPFQRLPAGLPREALAAGAHWLDIADDRDWLLRLLLSREHRLDAIAQEQRAAVIPGLSTTPALTGLLVRIGLESMPRPRSASFTLFIGNRNAKGAAAIASLLEDGATMGGFVPTPGGRRLACRVATADAALLRRDLGIKADFAVAFEFPAAGPLICGISPVVWRIDPEMRIRIARIASRLAVPFNSIGHDSGSVQAEISGIDGGRIRIALIGSGQRMAILSCAIALESLLDGTLRRRGVLQPALCFPPSEWMARLTQRGVHLISEY